MEWNQIRAALSRMTYPFPVAAAEEARARWEELSPHFIAELERVADGGSTTIDELTGEWDGLFSFAAFLAAEKRDVRAYAPLVRAGHCTSERADGLFGDNVGEGYGRLLASVCDGDPAPLRALVEDRAAGLWCRYAALHAQVVRVVEDDAERDELMAYIEDLCEREAAWLRQTDDDDDDAADDATEFLTWAADTSCELGPELLLERVRRWMNEGLIDPTVTGLSWFEKAAAKSVEECMAKAAKDDGNRYQRDALGEIGTWFCYEKPVPPPPRAARPQPAVTPVRTVPKVGRNDPCPCGSGKKYKKCCGKEGN
jgi:hypothetical protein